eukprot:3932305-Rhodomonas_salina.1
MSRKTVASGCGQHGPPLPTRIILTQYLACKSGIAQIKYWTQIATGQFSTTMMGKDAVCQYQVSRRTATLFALASYNIVVPGTA